MEIINLHLNATFILLSLVPSFAWLVFFLREDVHPEPKRMILKVFFSGMLAAIPVLMVQVCFRDLFDYLKIEQYSYFSFVCFAAVEEIVKFSVAYMAVRRSIHFDEPIDAMIYLVTAALGLAMVENLAIITKVKDLSEAINVTMLRFVGATLLHALSSGLVGYYWARNFIRVRVAEFITFRGRFLVLEGLIMATILHATFNYLIIAHREFLFYPIMFLMVAAMFILWDFEKIKARSLARIALKKSKRENI